MDAFINYILYRCIQDDVIIGFSFNKDQSIITMTAHGQLAQLEINPIRITHPKYIDEILRTLRAQLNKEVHEWKN
jgi:type II secretory pathway component PulC